MSYHGTSTSTTSTTSTARSTTNAQGQAAPAGYHYMPDGSLMLDSAHVNYTAAKVIKSFSLNTSNIKAAGEIRRFSVSGDTGAIFSLELKSGANYYNFKTNLFQAAQTKLQDVSVTGRTYERDIRFPLVAAGAQYDFYLTAGEGTEHSEYNEARFADGGIDINSTTGSNSNLIQKVIYQTLSTTVTINGYSPNETVLGTNTTSATILANRGGSVKELPFSYVFTVTSTRTLSINKQPSAKDIMAFISATVGALPIDVPGEDIHPTVTTAADATSDGGTTVNGASEGTTVTTHVVSSTIAAIGDRVLGNAALAAATVTVTAVSGGSGKTFTISEAIEIADDLPLTFSNQRNYRWPISSTSVDLSKITPGMRQLKSSFFARTPVVRDYVEQIVELEGTSEEKTIDKVRVPAIETFRIKPLIVRDATTKVVTTTVGAAASPINITFDQQALRTFGGAANAKIFSYGTGEVNRLTGYDMEFSDLNVALTSVSTTTTAAVSSNTSVSVAERAGIMDGISSVSGAGIDPDAANLTVSSGAGSVTGPGAIVLSAAQTLENGAVLTFPGAGTVITITGRIKINKAGNEDVTLRFDLEKFLTMH